MLKLPDYSKPFRIDLATNASDVAVGAELSQSGHPVAFYSKKLTPTKARYYVTDQGVASHLSSLYEMEAVPPRA